MPRGRGRPGAAAPRREPRAGPAPKPLKLLRRLPGATGEFLRLWIGDGGGSVSLSGPGVAEAEKRYAGFFGGGRSLEVLFNVFVVSFCFRLL